MSVEQQIDNIRDSWFIEEPMYFLTQSMFRITLSDNVTKIAAAPKRIYINRDYAMSLSYKELDSVLRIELIRILLRHPFTRFTEGCDPTIAYIASQIVIRNVMKFDCLDPFDLDTFLEKNGLGGDENDNNFHRFRYADLSYEEVYKKLARIIKNKMFDVKEIVGDCMASNYDEIESATKYWGDDVMSISTIRSIIEHIAGPTKKGIGTIPGTIIERIMADDPPCYDYKEPLRRFRHSVISSTKRMTRTKPSRRYGYEQMGSIVQYTSNVLIICDTSGSMDEKQLGIFIGFMNGFLSSGFSSVDCIQFDTSVIDSTIEKLKRKKYKYEFSGRGGTDITDIIDYVSGRTKKKYDGVIVFTDGGFDINKDKWESHLRGAKLKYVFCITDEGMYEKHTLSMKGIPNIDFTYLDLGNKWNS